MEHWVEEVRRGNAVEFEFEVGCAWEEEDVGWEEEPAGIADEKDGEPGTTTDTRECVVRTVPGTLNAGDEEGLNTDDALGL